MTNSERLHQAVIEQLSMVVDPETGADVIRMRLIEELMVDEEGRVSYTFRPSSPLCPIAVPLANTIQRTVSMVPGVTSQEVKVTGFILSDELMELLKYTLEEWEKDRKRKK